MFRVKSSLSSGDWVDVAISQNPVTDSQGAVGTVQNQVSIQLEKLISELPNVQNLVVLTGLGTSMCVSRSPSMSDLWESIKENWEKRYRSLKLLSYEEILILSIYGRLDAVSPGPRVITQLEQALARDIETLFDLCLNCIGIVEEGTQAKSIKVFIEQMKEVIVKKVSFVSEDDKLLHHENFLKRLIRARNYKDRLRIFTTNYDFCFEQAASCIGYYVVDGFSFLKKQAYERKLLYSDIIISEDYPDDGTEIDGTEIRNLFRLIKMHGSLDWVKLSEENSFKKEPGTEKPHIIYPARTKNHFIDNPPFSDMLEKFQNSIDTADSDLGTTLLVIGFGFNDDHIAEKILKQIEINQNLQTIIISLGLEKEQKNKHLSDINRMIRRGYDRAVMVDTTFEKFVSLLPDD